MKTPAKKKLPVMEIIPKNTTNTVLFTIREFRFGMANLEGTNTLPYYSSQ